MCSCEKGSDGVWGCVSVYLGGVGFGRCQPSPKPFLFVLFVFFIVNFKVRKRVCNVNFYQIAIGKKFKTWLSFKACPKGYVRVCLKSLHAQIAKGLIPLDHIFK